MPTPAPPSNPMARKQTDPTLDSYDAKLKRLLDRKRAGRSDAQIAEAAGMRPNALSRLLNGGVPDPRLSSITRVLKAIGATLCEFDRA